MNGVKNGMRVGGFFEFTCYDADGNVKWVDRVHNLVANVGLQHILDVLFAGTTQVTTWYVGLTAESPVPAAGDMLASHSGWTEFSDYADNRKEYVDVRSDQSVTNSASKASFSINASGTVGGGFLASASTGTSGTLLSCAALSGGNITFVGKQPRIDF
jgi:hypothetical protein